MSPALNGSSAIQRFEGNDAIKIRDGITFDFYTGLPHVLIPKHAGNFFRLVPTLSMLYSLNYEI